MARLVLPLIALSLALAACGESDSEQSGSKPAPKPAAEPAAKPADEVVIKDFKYGPASAAVKPGAKVTFVNQDSAAHTATVKGGFDTGTLNKGQSKAITVDKPGTYDYVCEFHAFMKGTLTVK